MNNFLRENGLEHAIPFFTYHEMEMEYLNDLTESQIEELLPNIGDRIKFKAGLEKLRGKKKSRGCRRSKETTIDKLCGYVKQIDYDAMKKEIAVQTLKSHKKLTEKLRTSAIEMISDHVSLSFYFKYKSALNRWTVINFENASLNCPFCVRDIALRYRPNAKTFTWNICGFQRHLNNEHSNLATLKFRAHGDNDKIC